MKKSLLCQAAMLALLLTPLLLFAGEKQHTANIAVAADEKTPGSNVSDRMGHSRLYLIYDAQGTFLKAVDNPNFGKGPGIGEGKSAIDSISFDNNGLMTGGISTPSREQREQMWKGFRDFFTGNGISIVVAGQFGGEIVRAMKDQGITCVEFNGKVEDSIRKILQLRKQKEAAQ